MVLAKFLTYLFDFIRKNLPKKGSRNYFILCCSVLFISQTNDPIKFQEGALISNTSSSMDGTNLLEKPPSVNRLPVRFVGLWVVLDPGGGAPLLGSNQSGLRCVSSKSDLIGGGGCAVFRS